MTETWKDIPSATGYQASDRGRVRSVDRVIKTIQGPKRRRGVVLVATPTQAGHLLVSVGRKSKRSVHSLVCEAFGMKTPEGGEIRHLDGRPCNNVLGNLCPDTRSQNNFDRTRHGKNKLKPEQVIEARERYLAGGVSGVVLASEYGVSKSLMYYALKGEYYAET